VPFANFIYRILIRRTGLKYYTIFIIPLYELRAEFAFVVISSHYYYLICYFLFNYINNFYKSREYFVYSFSL